MRTRSTGISTDPSRVTRGELAKTALNRRFRPISNPENPHRVCLLWPSILFRDSCCSSRLRARLPCQLAARNPEVMILMPFQKS